MIRMKMKTGFLLVLLIILFCFSCGDEISQSGNNASYGLYLLKDTLLITSEAKKIALANLELQDAPIIKLDDVIEYKWDEQLISITNDASARFKGVEKKIKSIYGLPFVVVAGQQKIYLGNIYPMYSSYMHEDLPSINVAPFLEMRILRAPMQSIQDKRMDERIYNVLAANNKLKK